jgi:two-component system response regulator YesN
MKNTILVVDDEEPIQELIHTYLSPLSGDIRSAFTGEEAVAMYEEMLEAGNRPDLVIMDLKMPGMDGIETTSHIMDMDPQARIYGFTAFSRSVWATEMKKAGARRVISRGIGFNGLREIVEETLETEKIPAY